MGRRRVVLKEVRSRGAVLAGEGVERIAAADVADQHVTGGVVRVEAGAGGEVVAAEAGAGGVVVEPPVLVVTVLVADEAPGISAAGGDVLRLSHQGDNLVVAGRSERGVRVERPVRGDRATELDQLDAGLRAGRVDKGLD